MVFKILALVATAVATTALIIIFARNLYVKYFKDEDTESMTKDELNKSYKLIPSI